MSSLAQRAGRKGGRPFKMTAAKLRLAMAAMGQPETKVGDPCQGNLGVTRADPVSACFTQGVSYVQMAVATSSRI